MKIWSFSGSLLTPFKKSIAPAVLGALLLLCVGESPAASGGLDLSFDPSFGVNGAVSSVIPQMDGKILLAGEFTIVRGGVRSRIARINADGTLDPTFDPGSGANDSVSFMIEQPDGKLLIGGNFTSINGVNRNRLARLNPDGSLDSSFNPDPETGAIATLSSLALQADGKVLLGGTITNSVFQPPSRILRLHGDGSWDDTFSANASGQINAIVLQPNGKLLVGGSFSSINGIGRSGIARLNSNGSLDTGFAVTGIDFFWGSLQKVYCLDLQTNGKVLIGASFYRSGLWVTRHEIVRLNSDGSLDVSFDSGMGPDYDGLSSQASFTFIESQQDGKILFGGHFDRMNATNRLNVARLNADGRLDLTFDPGSSAPGDLRCAAVQSDGNVLLGGNFRTSISGRQPNHLLRLDATGSVDSPFVPTIQAAIAPDVSSMVLQPDGKVLLGSARFFGGFQWDWAGISRLNWDGSWDSTFDPGSGPNFPVMSVALQNDGRVLLGGAFTAVDGTNRNRIARLNSDGSLDDSFQSNPDSLVRSVTVQPDGKVLVGGPFSSINGTNRKGIARLHSDGSLDETFDPGTGVIGQVYCIVLQPDGKVLLGGDFGDVNGMGWLRVARLNQDGSVDTSFDPGTGVSDVVRSIALQPDGKLLLGGRFSLVNGTTRNGIARLNPEGSLDTTFDPGTGVAPSMSEVHSVSLQKDGKVMLGGSFSSVNGKSLNGIARLNTDGTLDSAFDPGGGVTGIIYSGVSTVFAIAVQPNGRIIIGGNFKNADGVARERVARLLGDSPALVSAPVKENGDLVCQFRGIFGLTYTLEYRKSLSSGTWQKLLNLTAPETDLGLGAGVFEFRDPIPASGMRYYRVVDPAY
ncbi:MAG: hypothetical protein H0X66_04070 [Verrucomicrobia bacterium]|nr:hypothetical protein [Verrucomicrobiota bacterium]